MKRVFNYFSALGIEFTHTLSVSHTPVSLWWNPVPPDFRVQSHPSPHGSFGTSLSGSNPCRISANRQEVATCLVPLGGSW